MKGLAGTGIKRPVILSLISIAYIAAPLVNIALLRIFTGLPMSLLMPRVVASYGLVASLWLATAPLVGIGFYFVKAASWYIFVGHSGVILADYAFKWITRPSYYLGSIGSLYHLDMLAGNLLLIAVVGYVARKNFRAPYFQALPRSWRESTRVPIHQRIFVNGESRKTTDMSGAGCFVEDPESALGIGDRPSLRFHADKLAIECKGEVMRLVQTGCGIRFIALRSPQRRAITLMLRKRFPLRYEANVACVWWWNGAARAATVRNVSAGGCYIQAGIHDLAEGAQGELIIDDLGQTLAAKVIWINAAGMDEKPMGFGCLFSRKQLGLVRILKQRYGTLALTR